MNEMADDESLRLPKPLPGSDFLTFAADRRWDLLGFVKTDEIEEIKSVELGADGHRYYLIHWKETWKSESSLIYCNKLLQEFWLKKSLIQQQELLSDSSSKLIQASTEETGDGLQRIISVEDVVTHGSDNLANVSGISTSNQDIVTENISNVASQKISLSSVNQDLEIDLQVNVACDRGDPMKSEAPQGHSKDVLTIDKTEISDDNDDNDDDDDDDDDANDDDDDDNDDDDGNVDDDDDDDDDEEEDDDDSDNGISIIEPLTNEKQALKSRRSIEKNEVDEVDICINNVNKTRSQTLGGLMESSSKKGAPKRKARPPRQSVASTNDTAIVNRKREKKGKDKGKKCTKIPKTVSTLISPRNKSSNAVEEPTETIEDTSTVNVGNLKCMVCDKHLASEQSLMKHLLTHNNNHTCTICMKTFKSTHFLKHHMDKHNTSYQYSCPKCSKKFKFKNNMRGHLRKHNMEKKFECEVCQKRFIGRYNLREHMKAHSDNRPYECDFCKKAYKDRGALNKHMLTHQEKKVQCEVCMKSFTNAVQVKRHMQFHYSWPGDSFKRKSNVGADGEKVRFKCPHCEKSFNHYSNMNAHIHKKHKEKKIQCTKCPKMFAYQYELREHMFVHEGGDNSKFKCQFCDKTFQRSTTLKNHERTTHLGIKRFKCNVCGKMFGTKFNMKVHVEKLHREGADELFKTKALSPSTRHVASSLIASNPGNLMNPLPVVSMAPPIGAPHPLLRNLSTSDIIRNAMSHMPEMNYFPSLQPRGYQFYGIPPSDFGVS